MSMHKRDDGPALEAALALHGLPHDTPSQLSDAFRCGWDRRASHDEMVVLMARALAVHALAQGRADDGVQQLDAARAPHAVEAIGSSDATLDDLIARLRAEAYMTAARAILSTPGKDEPGYKTWDGERPRICEESAYRRIKALADQLTPG